MTAEVDATIVDPFYYDPEQAKLDVRVNEVEYEPEEESD